MKHKYSKKNNIVRNGTIKATHKLTPRSLNVHMYMYNNIINHTSFVKLLNVYTDLILSANN